MKDNLLFSNIDDELKDSYFNYAAYIIMFRVLPDIRDGLKPVQRRILYAMYINGSRYSDKLKKSSKIVGYVMGEFHPHGDSAIYNTMVRMTQNFSCRCIFVIGQGNFGSIDGDTPAASRYTEVKLSKYSMQFFTDFHKNTAFMIPNYDGSLEEPKFLPTRIPNLLINGNQGIAVGISTSFPPHNLTEVLNALIYLLENPHCTLDDILNIIKGPDFPTGGIIAQNNLRDIYLKGEGNVYIRGKYHFEDNLIVFTEIPFQVEKSRIIEQIFETIQDGRIPGISSVIDESDREGMRIVIKMKKNVQKEIVVNQIFNFTNLKSTFHCCFYALNEDGKPQLYNLMGILKSFLQFREDIITKRVLKDLEDYKKRLHILIGYAIAWENIDDIINLLKDSNNLEETKHILSTMSLNYNKVKSYIPEELNSNYKLSTEQIEAILSLKLQNLVKLEINKTSEEMQVKFKNIEKCYEILSSDQKRKDIIKEELIEIINSFNLERKTNLVPAFSQISEESLIDPEDTLIIVNENNYIKRINLDAYKNQNRGGKGKSFSSEMVRHSVVANTKDKILLFGDKGILYMLNCYEIPEGDNYSKGRALINLVSIDKDENILSVIPTSNHESILFVSKNGYIRRNKMQDFLKLRVTGKKYMDNPDLVSILTANEDDIIFIGTKFGMAICTKVSQFRVIGSRASDGVIGCKLRTGDEVVSAIIVRKPKILSISESGFGKISNLSTYRQSNRGAIGVINMSCSDKTGNVVGVMDVDDEDDVLALSEQGQIIRFQVNQIRTIGRNTKGVLICNLDKNDKLKFVQRIL